MSHSSAVSALANHTSVRKFDGVKMSREEVVELIQASQMAASSNFFQAYSIVWLEDDAKRQEVGEICKNAVQYTTCAAAFVICVDFSRLALSCEKHGKDIFAHSAESLLIGVSDAAIFAQNLVAISEIKNYGTCYIGGIRTNIEEINTALNLPHYVFPLFGITIGTPGTALNEVKPRFPVESILFTDSYSQDKQKDALDEYDEIMKDYFKNRSATSMDATWSEKASAAIAKHSRPHMKAYLEKKGFGFE